MSKPLRTGYFGGSFNPIHEGHIRLADRACQSGLVDEVWFVVSPQNPLKSTADPNDAASRLAAVREALQPYPHLIASGFELDKPLPSYTIDNLNLAASQYPDRTFVLIIGGDNLDDLTRWKDYEQLLSNYDILVYPRPGASNTIPQGWQRVKLLDGPLMAISSTEIRQKADQ